MLIYWNITCIDPSVFSYFIQIKEQKMFIVPKPKKASEVHLNVTSTVTSITMMHIQFISIYHT